MKNDVAYWRDEAPYDEFDRNFPPFVESEESEGEQLPTAEEMNDEQVTDAVQRIHEDTAGYPRFPWDELHGIAGLMAPEDLWMVAGRTGNGKSLFLMNLFDGLIEHGRRILYLGLEQSPVILRVKWACLRAGVKAKLMLAPTPEDKAHSFWESQRADVAREFKWQQTPDVKGRAHFAATRFIDKEGLRKWTEWAVGMGCDMVIVDHVDRVKHGEGKNSFHEVSETIRLAKELATEHRIVMFLASQVGRPGDPLQKFMPPGVSELRGAGTKEEESDAVLAVYRPLKAGTTQGDLTKVRQGLMDEAEIYERDMMAVRILKHRLDGADALGRHCLLRVERGRVVSRPIREEGRYNV